MQSRHSARKSRGPRRRKVALACESCRERKSRCDGQKPICGPCARRAYPIDRCIYKSENARSASNDEYLEALHHRIRELEQACRQADVAMPASQVEDSSTSVRESAALPITDGIPSPLNPSHENPAGAEDDVNTSRTLQGADTHTGLGGIPSSRPRGEYAASYSALAFNSPHTDLYPSPTPFDPRSTVTGMGAVDAVRERERPPNQVNDYFGSSSTASLIRHLTQNPARGFDHPAAPNTPTQPPAGSATPTRGGELPSLIQEDWTRSRLRVDNFFLPPRDLADHLLERFWDRIYCIYPFFDRGSFQNAYENLWVPRNEPGKNLSEQDIGLGNRLNSGNTSIVFICALNIVFALGCHFADIPVAEREPLAHTFFLRSKQHIGLDMLDLRNVGVVQTLLIVALYLQSTPYPHRCWNSIGVACRLAQGLGMHEAQMYALKGPLEQEIHRRTWHGCVMMDKIVSMTYGRPSMTSHLPSVPLPGDEGLSPVGETRNPSLLAFYIATIELYQILDSILSDVYKAWRGRSSSVPTSDSGGAIKQAGLDVVVELEEKLIDYESNLPSFLSWTHQSTTPIVTSASDQLTLHRQRNVLHARFLYLRLLLYRPIFTRLCSETCARNATATDGHSSLYSSILSKCAASCVRAAVDLISLVHYTYQTSTTDTWWYNGFYTSTAGIVLLISYTAPSSAVELPIHIIDTTWHKCEQVLQHMAAFSISARNTLQFLLAAKAHIPNQQQQQQHPGSHQRAPNMDSTSQHHDPLGRPISTGPNIQNDASPHAAADNNGVGQLFNWDFSMGGLPSASDEMGFLGSIDFNDFQGWLTDEIL